MSDPVERWKSVVGYESLYEVSSHGNVRRLDKLGSDGRRLKAKLMKPQLSGRYYHVTLTRNGRETTANIHVLVLEAFRGPRPEGHEACHGTAGRHDNHLDNLTWGTGTKNRLDTTEHGNNVHANKTHCPSGHPYSGDNLVTRPRTLKDGTMSTRRDCRACHNERRRVSA